MIAVFTLDNSLTGLHWHSDWNGEDVGYEDISVLALYSVESSPNIHMYINTETREIVELFCLAEGCEGVDSY